MQAESSIIHNDPVFIDIFQQVHLNESHNLT